MALCAIQEGIMNKKLLILLILLALLALASPATAKKQLDPVDIKVMQEKIADTAMIVGVVGTILITILIPWSAVGGLLHGSNEATEEIKNKLFWFLMLCTAIALRNIIGAMGLYLMDYDIPSTWIWV
jgi:hypothetical protein